MKDFESLAHVRWECKYHVIFIPKYRRKVIYGKLRAQVGAILRDLCKQKDIGLLEGHAVSDHVHLTLNHQHKPQRGFPHVNASLCEAGQTHALRAWSLRTGDALIPDP